MIEQKRHIFKKGRYITFILGVVFSLLIFPLIVFNLISLVNSKIELNKIEESINQNSYSTITLMFDDYFNKYSTDNGALAINQAFLDSQEKNWDLYIKKIINLNLIINNSWFPSYQYYLELAKVYLEMNYHQEALFYLENEVILENMVSSADKMEYYQMLYYIYDHLELYDSAIVYAQKLIDFDEDKFNWMFKLASSYLKNKDYNSARLELEKLMSIKSSSPEFKQKVFFTLISILEYLKLEEKINFYYQYVLFDQDQEQRDDFLKDYAYYLINHNNGFDKAVEIWKVPYSIIKPTSKKDIKKEFEKYIKNYKQG